MTERRPTRQDANSVDRDLRPGGLAGPFPEDDDPKRVDPMGVAGDRRRV